MDHQLTPSETFTTASPDGIGVPVTPKSPFDGLELPSEAAAKLVASVINHYQGVDAGEVSLGSEPGANPIAEPQPPINPGDALSPELSWREQIAATWGSVAEKFSPRKRVGVAIAALALVGAACGGSGAGETSTAGDASSGGAAVAEAPTVTPEKAAEAFEPILPTSTDPRILVEQLYANLEKAYNTGNLDYLDFVYADGGRYGPGEQQAAKINVAKRERDQGAPSVESFEVKLVDDGTNPEYLLGNENFRLIITVAVTSSTDFPNTGRKTGPNTAIEKIVVTPLAHFVERADGGRDTPTIFLISDQLTR